MCLAFSLNTLTNFVKCVKCMAFLPKTMGWRGVLPEVMAGELTQPEEPVMQEFLLQASTASGCPICTPEDKVPRPTPMI